MDKATTSATGLVFSFLSLQLALVAFLTLAYGWGWMGFSFVQLHGSFDDRDGTSSGL